MKSVLQFFQSCGTCLCNCLNENWKLGLNLYFFISCVNFLVKLYLLVLAYNVLWGFVCCEEGVVCVCLCLRGFLLLFGWFGFLLLFDSTIKIKPVPRCKIFCDVLEPED